MNKPNMQTPPPDVTHPLFRTNPSLWPNVSSTIHKKHFRQDERIISHGDEAGHLWLVYNGWVKLTRQTPDGKETVTGLCTEGDIFGEAALFTGTQYPYTAEVIGNDADVACIPAPVMRAIIAKDAPIATRIMALLNERLSEAQLKLEQMSTMSAAQRLGCFLLRLCHMQAGGTKTLHIPVEKNILATYLGMKPETLSRGQQQLKPLGISVTGHDITVQDISKLRQFVCDSCSQSGNCSVESSLG